MPRTLDSRFTRRGPFDHRGNDGRIRRQLAIQETGSTAEVAKWLRAPVVLVIDGGYPELHGKALAANEAMRESIRRWADDGGTIYAECGGLMYLTETIHDIDGAYHPEVGLFPIETVMGRDTLTLGCRTLIVETPCLLEKAGIRVKGHEFHYSRLESRNGQGSSSFTCVTEDASGRERRPDGLLTLNTLALYTHLHFVSCSSVARSLLVRAWQEAEA